MLLLIIMANKGTITSHIHVQPRSQDFCLAKSHNEAADAPQSRHIVEGVIFAIRGQCVPSPSDCKERR